MRKSMLSFVAITFYGSIIAPPSFAQSAEDIINLVQQSENAVNAASQAVSEAGGINQGALEIGRDVLELPAVLATPIGSNALDLINGGEALVLDTSILADSVTNARDNLQNGIDGLLNGVTDAAQSQIDGVTNAAQGQIDNVTDAAQAQIDAARESLDEFTGQFDAVQGSIDSITGQIDAFQNGGFEGLLEENGGIDGLIGAVESGSIPGLPDDVTNLVADLNNLGESLSTLEDDAREFVENTLNDLQEQGTEFLTGLADDALDDLSDLANNALEDILGDNVSNIASNLVANTPFGNLVANSPFGAIFGGGDDDGNGGGDGILVEPPCSNSKCISLDMIAVAQHEDVEFDDVPSYILELSHAEPCVDPRPSGVTVFKQIPGRTIEFPDTFCTNQGCTPHADGSECQ